VKGLRLETAGLRTREKSVVLQPRVPPSASFTTRGGSYSLQPTGAFTLIELIVVLTILGILGAMIVPQFASTYVDALLRASGRELVAGLNLSYSLAVGRQSSCRLVLDPGSGAWRIEELRTGEGGVEEFGRVQDVPGAWGRIDRKISVRLLSGSEEDRPSGDPLASSPSRGSGPEAPPEGILFRPDGTAEAREIVLRDPEGFALSIRVDSVTSRVRIAALEREEAEP
jgi:prepilin-type N-terminal cleavage/methylation domain-containing protein